MSSSGKITTISCQIDLGAIEPIDFRTIVPNGHTFNAAQRFNQFNVGHDKKWVIDVGKCSCTLYSSLYVYYYQSRKKASQSLNSVWLASKQVSLHNSNIRTLVTFKFHRQDIHDIFIIPAKFYTIWGWLQKGHSTFKSDKCCFTLHLFNDLPLWDVIHPPSKQKLYGKKRRMMLSLLVLHVKFSE